MATDVSDQPLEYLAVMATESLPLTLGRNFLDQCFRCICVLAPDCFPDAVCRRHDLQREVRHSCFFVDHRWPRVVDVAEAVAAETVTSLDWLVLWSTALDGE